MDLRQLEYIVTIEREKNISRAAEKLYLTQSALNQQLLRLEQDVGMPLFERRNRVMVPTYAGRIYLDAAKRMLDIKRETYKAIQDIADEQGGEIAIAYSPEAGARLFSAVYPLFHEKYPGVTFKIHEERVKVMERLLLQKTVDMACLTYYKERKNPALEYIATGSEHIVLGLPVKHPLAYLAGERSYETLPLIDLKLLENEKFVIQKPETLIREMVDLMFSHAGFVPKILFEASSTLTAINIVRAQIAPAFFPESYVDPDAPMVYFTVAPNHKWVRSVGFLRGSYLTKPEKYLIELIKAHYQKLRCGMEDTM